MIKKRITISIVVLLVPLLLVTCKNTTEPDTILSDPGIQILKNTNVEQGINVPENWSPWSLNHSKYAMWSNDNSFSPTHSLKISLDYLTDKEELAYWIQTLNSDIPFGKNLTLQAFVKLENVIGNGISLVIRGDNTAAPSDSAEVFSTTQENIKISGTMDWTMYSVTLPNVPANIRSISVYLLFLPKTQGTVYFDNISLYAK